MNIRDYVKDHILLTDGAMGTYLDQIESENYICSEEANLSNPELILKIHKDYISSGSRLIRTNTFQANRVVAGRLKEKYPELADSLSVKSLIKSGYEIGLKASKEAAQAGIGIYVAADIGPIREPVDVEKRDILEEYFEICDAFLEFGADIFVFETFPDERYVVKMAEYVKKRKPDSFLIGQFCFEPTGFSHTSHQYRSVIEKAANCGFLDAVGFNCGVGAAHMKKFIAELLDRNVMPENVIMTSLPNCGFPQIVRGRAVYSDSIDYFSRMVMEILDYGVTIVGGCCGTVPAYIAAIREQIEKKNKGYIRICPVKKHVYRKEDHVAEQEIIKNTFREKLELGETVYAVELDPPYNHDISSLLKGAEILKETKADIITLADSPMARARADSVMTAGWLKNQTGIDVMPHLCCRDRNRISIRGTVLGAYISEIRNMLIITGDPVNKEARSFTKSVFEFNSIKLMDFLKGMNHELFSGDPIYYGGAINQNSTNPDAVANRVLKKMEAGCRYFLTQPVYSKEDVDKINRIREKTGAKILLGIMPLVSYRNALFIKNEMPGIHVSDEILAKYRPEGTKEEWEETAVSICTGVMEYAKNAGAGFYMMTPFNRVTLIEKIMNETD